MTNYTHQGTITFNTNQRLERPYLDDLERKIAERIATYLKEQDFKFAQKKFRINICMYNTPSILLPSED